MRNYNKVALILAAFLVLVGCTRKQDVLQGEYLGQKPPGKTPVIFAPGVISTGLSELNSIFSPDGSEFYFCVRNSFAEAVFFYKSIDNVWIGPHRLPFTDQYGEIDISISPDGTKMFFCSKRIVPGNDQPKNDHDIWMSNKTGNERETPIHLTAVNSEFQDFYPVTSNNGTLFFNSQREGIGTNNIYMSKFIDGQYTEAVKLGPAINTENREFDPFIAPDESFIIFASGRPGGFGNDDLYISYKDENDSWTESINMGEQINSSRHEFSPVLSPDGKYLFFTSNRTDRPDSLNKITSYDEFEKMNNSPAYGSTDIYWVDASIVRELKPVN